MHFNAVVNSYVVVSVLVNVYGVVNVCDLPIVYADRLSLQDGRSFYILGRFVPCSAVSV